MEMKLNWNRSQLMAVVAATLIVAGCSDSNNGGGEDPFVPTDVTSDPVAVSGGTVADAVSVSTPSATGTEGAYGASVDIQPDTQLLDAGGQPITSSSFTTSVEAYDGSAASEELVTGGLISGSTLAADTQGSQDLIDSIAQALGASVPQGAPVKLDVAGWADISVTTNDGQVVSSFNPPLEAKIQAPSLASGDDYVVVGLESGAIVGQGTIQKSVAKQGAGVCVVTISIPGAYICIGNLVATSGS